MSRDGATEARGRQANPGRGADAGAQRRPAARRARRVDGGTSRRRGELTGALTLSRWWGRGTDARGTKARAHTTPQDGPARGRRRERGAPGPGRRTRCIGGPEPRRAGSDATEASRRSRDRGPGATAARAEHDERDATGRGAVTANAARIDDWDPGRTRDCTSASSQVCIA